MELQAASTEALVRTPVEPKLFFANERTYLHCERRPNSRSRTVLDLVWRHREPPRACDAGMHACVTLASVAMALTAASNATTPLRLAAGIILSLASIGLMAYAYWTFNWRATRIAARSGQRADDPIGPTLLSGVLIAAMIAAAACTLPKAL